MSNRFDAQYDLLGLKAPESDMDPLEKAEMIFHAACLKKGIDPMALPLVSHLPEEFQVFPVVSYQLEVIGSVIRNGVKANWNSSKQKKYDSWFWMDAPGFRFGGSHYAISSTVTGGGSRLCTFSEEDQDFFSIECIPFWAAFCGSTLPS